MTDQQKPWGDDADFNPEKAWTLIQNLRSELDQAKADRATAITERDAAVRDRDTATTRVSELEADAQSKGDALAAKERELNDAGALRTKEHLLIDAGLPRDLASNIVGDDEEAWKGSVDRFAALRTTLDPVRTPNPAQSVPGSAPSDDETARSFFGL